MEETKTASNFEFLKTLPDIVKNIIDNNKVQDNGISVDAYAKRGIGIIVGTYVITTGIVFLRAITAIKCNKEE